MFGPALAHLIGKNFPLVGVVIVAVAAPIGIVLALIYIKGSIFLVVFMALCFIAAIQQYLKLRAEKRK